MSIFKNYGSYSDASHQSEFVDFTRYPDRLGTRTKLRLPWQHYTL